MIAEIVQLIRNELDEAKRQRMTGEIEVRIIVNEGGVRDCYSSVRKKIQKSEKKLDI